MDHPAVSAVAIICALVLVLVLGCLMDFPDWRKRTEVKPSNQIRMKKFLIIAALALFAFLISLTGCKKVDPKPCKKELTQDSIQRIFRQKLIH